MPRAVNSSLILLLLELLLCSRAHAVASADFDLYGCSEVVSLAPEIDPVIGLWEEKLTTVKELRAAIQLLIKLPFLERTLRELLARTLDTGRVSVVDLSEQIRSDLNLGTVRGLYTAGGSSRYVVVENTRELPNANVELGYASREARTPPPPLGLDEGLIHVSNEKTALLTLAHELAHAFLGELFLFGKFKPALGGASIPMLEHLAQHYPEFVHWTGDRFEVEGEFYHFLQETYAFAFMDWLHESLLNHPDSGSEGTPGTTFLPNDQRAIPSNRADWIARRYGFNDPRITTLMPFSFSSLILGEAKVPHFQIFNILEQSGTDPNSRGGVIELGEVRKSTVYSSAVRAGTRRAWQGAVKYAQKLAANYRPAGMKARTPEFDQQVSYTIGRAAAAAYESRGVEFKVYNHKGNVELRIHPGQTSAWNRLAARLAQRGLRPYLEYLPIEEIRPGYPPPHLAALEGRPERVFYAMRKMVEATLTDALPRGRISLLNSQMIQMGRPIVDLRWIAVNNFILDFLHEDKLIGWRNSSGEKSWLLGNPVESGVAAVNEENLSTLESALLIAQAGVLRARDSISKLSGGPHVFPFLQNHQHFELRIQIRTMPPPAGPLLYLTIVPTDFSSEPFLQSQGYEIQLELERGPTLPNLEQAIQTAEVWLQTSKNELRKFRTAYTEFK